MTSSHKIGCIVLAAGQSKRLKSKVAKIFHDLAGRSVLGHVLHTLNQLPLNQVVIVASPITPMHPDYLNHTVIVQDRQLGTGHAASMGVTGFGADDIEEVIIVCGDTPLLLPETLMQLIKSTADLTLLVASLPDHLLDATYGRVMFEHDKPIRIVEYKDADDSVRASPLINAGVYKIKVDLLKKLLPQLSNENAGNEYYLTDLVHLAVECGAEIQAILVDFEEVLGINTRIELEKVDAIIQSRLVSALMANGVTFQQPQTTRLSVDTVIGQDTVIEPCVIFKKGVTINTNVRIKSFSYLENCHLKDGVSVGPHAHIRGGCVLDEDSEVGNFVELKATHLGKKAKAKHLTYLGDATVGNFANIGAGTITANYDGFFKHKTIIDESVHLGANTVLVAPLTVGAEAMTAAGAVITENVPPGALAISRTPQKNKENWACLYKEKMRNKKKIN
ncbi:MAG: bifunctional UDP-N-acetylglucosamine diphosphorylase/glucosamine-1-phosphate N-acetyltransferase GlmU [Candidatus Paracaedibacteraceae bacterium]|nr:bifunctional UDP-N-acetylglucosamine diphosphorylase/glucosamine-1-phosphate N-acetyltransferase GlmU [Candidatus Paracaedibacteraceae bacterium]